MTDMTKYGPWAVIAGGSEGVGAEFARQLAGGGLNLMLIARAPGPLADTARRCRETGVHVRTIAVDLVDPEAVALICSETADLEVGLLIYNAGANTCREQFLDAELTELGRVIDLNVTRMLELVQHFGRPMRARRRGGIVLVGSTAATYGAMRQSGRCFTSARSRRSSAASALATLGRWPASTCALRTQFKSVWGTPMPSLFATDWAAAQSEGYSGRTSPNMRIARSRSPLYLFMNDVPIRT
ncbi:SDR family NAD(P)-dependent oxidoreductase, partial [Mycobacterium marinum]|uniref:SDR family NAD(P)-dependent oxidoreductase n=1 Tax=Mycobacterium marinum TaxID=1781 RepID=UPI00356A8E93